MPAPIGYFVEIYNNSEQLQFDSWNVDDGRQDLGTVVRYLAGKV